MTEQRHWPHRFFTRDPEPGTRNPESGDNWVSASEIAAYTYCARAYWLECVQHVERPPQGNARLEAGQAHHRVHGRRVATQRWFIRIAVALLVGAALLLWAPRR